MILTGACQKKASLCASRRSQWVAGVHGRDFSNAHKQKSFASDEYLTEQKVIFASTEIQRATGFYLSPRLERE